VKLTKNEKKVLKLLLDNSRISDSTIATKLKISSQAVGKIRKKLEKSLITKYTLDINFSKLGVQTFAIALAKITEKGLDKGQLEVEEKLLSNPHLISVYRIPKGNVTHVLICGFKDLTDLDEFFHSPKIKQDLHKYIEINDMFTFSHHSLMKNNPNQLLHKIIDSLDKSKADLKFSEIEQFKKQL